MTTSISDVIRTYFTVSLAGDKNALEEGLSDDFTFTSPSDNHISKATFFEKYFSGRTQFRVHRIEQLFTQNNEASVRYAAELMDGTTFRNMEYIRVEGNKIKEVELYVGSSQEGLANEPLASLSLTA